MNRDGMQRERMTLMRVGRLVFLLALLLPPALRAQDGLQEARVRDDLRACLSAWKADSEGCPFSAMETAFSEPDAFEGSPEIAVYPGRFTRPDLPEALALVQPAEFVASHWLLPQALLLHYVCEDEVWRLHAFLPFYSTDLHVADFTGDGLDEVRILLDHCRLGDCRWYAALLRPADGEMQVLYERSDFSRSMYLDTSADEAELAAWTPGDTVGHTAEVVFRDTDGDGDAELVERHRVNLFRRADGKRVDDFVEFERVWEWVDGGYGLGR